MCCNSYATRFYRMLVLSMAACLCYKIPAIFFYEFYDILKFSWHVITPYDNYNTRIQYVQEMLVPKN